MPLSFSKLLLLSALAASLALAGEPPLMMIRLRGPHTASDAQWAKTFKALTENRGACDEVWFSTGIGFPKMSWHEAHVKRLARYADHLRAAGIVPSLQFQATLGHSDMTTALEGADGKTWGGFTGRGGLECTHCNCPRQPGFLAYVREMARLYASFRPGGIWIDDDLRIAGHSPGSPWEREKDGWIGCWCRTCIGDFNRETGGNWTRESLDAAMKKDAALFDRWETFSVFLDCRSSEGDRRGDPQGVAGNEARLSARRLPQYQPARVVQGDGGGDRHERRVASGWRSVLRFGSARAEREGVHGRPSAEGAG